MYNDRITLRRAGWRWYVFILFGVPLLILLGIIIQPGILASFQGLSSRLAVTYPAYFFIVFFGIIFAKTKNLAVTWVTHYAADVVGIISLVTVLAIL